MIQEKEIRRKMELTQEDRSKMGSSADDHLKTSYFHKSIFNGRHLRFPELLSRWDLPGVRVVFLLSVYFLGDTDIHAAIKGNYLARSR